VCVCVCVCVSHTYAHASAHTLMHSHTHVYTFTYSLVGHAALIEGADLSSKRFKQLVTIFTPYFKSNLKFLGAYLKVSDERVWVHSTRSIVS
jgi:hypothetical protein